MMVICRNTKQHHNAIEWVAKLQCCSAAQHPSRRSTLKQMCHSDVSFSPHTLQKKRVNWLWRSQLLCRLTLSGAQTRFTRAVLWPPWSLTRHTVQDPARPWVKTQEWGEGGGQCLFSFSENTKSHSLRESVAPGTQCESTQRKKKKILIVCCCRWLSPWTTTHLPPLTPRKHSNSNV